MKACVGGGLDMRLVFLGTPAFAAVSLRALIKSEHQVVAVVSQPDRRAGRGNKLRSPPVAVVAREHDIPLLQVESVAKRAVRDWVAGHQAELGVVTAFGHILGPKMLASLPRGFINVHASLLPRWRGASPIQQAVLAGDHLSGVSIMQLDQGLDTGDVWLTREVALSADETAATLHDKLAELGAEALVETLDGLVQGQLSATPQAHDSASYAAKLTRSDGVLNWSDSAAALSQRIRALHPWPGTRFHLNGELIRVLPPVTLLGPVQTQAAPGTVLGVGPEGLDVLTGDAHLIRLLQLQRPGKRALRVADFLSGCTVALGALLE